jgi:hypothetical protein
MGFGCVPANRDTLPIIVLFVTISTFQTFVSTILISRIGHLLIKVHHRSIAYVRGSRNWGRYNQMCVGQHWDIGGYTWGSCHRYSANLRGQGCANKGKTKDH